MSGFAYNSKAEATASVTEPTDFPDGWTFPTPYPPGWEPTQGGTTWSRTINYNGTTGGGEVFLTPEGSFTLSSAELDSSSVKTGTLGGLTFTYSGSSYGGRGTLTIAGTGSYASTGQTYGGQYYWIPGITGTPSISGTVVVATGGVRYTSSGESYSNQLLAAATAILAWNNTNRNVIFRSPL